MDCCANALSVIWCFEDNRTASVCGSFIEEATEESRVRDAGAVREDVRLSHVLKDVLVEDRSQKWVSDGV